MKLDIYIYQLILVLETWNFALETWNFAHTLRGSILAFFGKRFFWFDLNLYLYLMVWLEIWCLTKTCAKDSKLGTHLGGTHTSIFEEIFFWFDLNLYLYLWFDFKLDIYIQSNHIRTRACECKKNVYPEFPLMFLKQNIG